MSKRLIESERRFIADMAPNIEAKRVASALTEIGAEITRRARTEAECELAELDAFRIERARELLRILDTEVTRLRLAIGCHKYGRLDNASLWRMPDNWNAPQPEVTPMERGV